MVAKLCFFLHFETEMVGQAPAAHLMVSPSILAHQDPRLIACFMFTGAFDWLANGDIFSPGIMLVMMLVACLSVIMFTVIQAGVQWNTLCIRDLFIWMYTEVEFRMDVTIHMRDQCTYDI